MLPFLKDLLREPRRTRTVILLDEDGTGSTETYRLLPSTLVAIVGGAAAAIAVILVLLILFTPLRKPILGTDTESLRAIANQTTERVVALSDSLEAQQAYIEILRSTLIGIPATGDVPDATEQDLDTTEGSTLLSDTIIPVPAEPLIQRVSLSERAATDSFLQTFPFPALPPVSGFLARGFDSSRGHWGLDLAVPVGTTVRSIGDGHVIFADWTNDGGYTLAIQHLGGFLSVYKHNSTLLKRVGSHVSDREAIALSGNTGEATSGPHLHFELWRDGLAQDPLHYLLNIQVR